MKLARAFLNSRKAQAGLVGLAFAFFGERVAGITADQVNDAVNLLIAYIVGQGVADAGMAVAEAKKPS